MTDFVPPRVYPSYYFEIKRNRQGYWIASDRHDLAGGTFRTRMDALRFALFESDGDSVHVHRYPEAQAARNTKRHYLWAGQLS